MRALRFGAPFVLLGQDFLYYSSRYVGESEFATHVLVGQARVVHA